MLKLSQSARTKFALSGVVVGLFLGASCIVFFAVMIITAPSLDERLAARPFKIQDEVLVINKNPDLTDDSGQSLFDKPCKLRVGDVLAGVHRESTRYGDTFFVRVMEAGSRQLATDSECVVGTLFFTSFDGFWKMADPAFAEAMRRFDVQRAADAEKELVRKFLK